MMDMKDKATLFNLRRLPSSRASARGGFLSFRMALSAGLDFSISISLAGSSSIAPPPGLGTAPLDGPAPVGTGAAEGLGILMLLKSGSWPVEQVHTNEQIDL